MSLFDTYGVERALKEALSEKIWLKCGGHIIIQQTEAMVSIDVNTGGSSENLTLITLF